MTKTKKRQQRKNAQIENDSEDYQIKTRNQSQNIDNISHVSENANENLWENSPQKGLKENKMESINLEKLVAYLPCFDGRKNKNIEFFLSQWESIAQNSSLNEGIKLLLLKAKFTGEAKNAIIANPILNEELNYANFKNKIKSEFKTTENFEDTQNEFLTLKQDASQSITEFIKIFNILANKYVNNSGQASQEGVVNFIEKLKLSRFLEAIRKDIAFEIRKLDPKDFNEATEIALRLEKAYNYVTNEEINFNSVKQPIKCKINDENNALTEESEIINYENKIAQLEEQLKKFKITENKQTNESKQQKHCAICDTSSHSTKKCFYNGKNKFRNDIKFNDRNYMDNRRNEFNMYPSVNNPLIPGWTHQNYGVNYPNHSNYPVPLNEASHLNSMVTPVGAGLNYAANNNMGDPYQRSNNFQGRQSHKNKQPYKGNNSQNYKQKQWDKFKDKKNFERTNKRNGGNSHS